MGSANGEEVVDLSDPCSQGRRGDQPSNSPSCDRESLARAADADCSIGHPLNRGDADMFPAINEMLVDLIGDRNRVMLDAEFTDQIELTPREHLSCGVVRRVDDYRSSPAVERASQLVIVERPIRSSQRYIAGNGAAKNAVRSVVLVEGLE